MGPIVFAVVDLSEELHDEKVVGDRDVPAPPGHVLPLLPGGLPPRAKVEHFRLANLPGPEIGGLDLPLVSVAEENLSNCDVTRRNYK